MSSSSGYRVASLAETPFHEIHACFIQAFADYVVTAVQMNEAALSRRARKNNWAPELSAGVWADDALVAVSLTGVDNVNCERRAYDIATGIVAQHRGQGLAGRIMRYLEPLLHQAGVAAMQLEVLQSNTAGIRAYEKAGFITTRGLVSHAADAPTILADHISQPVVGIGLPDLLGLSSHLGFEPSFEQRDAAIENLQQELDLLGVVDGTRCVAAIAYDPHTDWIMRLVTHRKYRRRGLASALLAALASRYPAGKQIKAVNIDQDDQASRALMKMCGLAESIWQWEMRLAL